MIIKRGAQITAVAAAICVLTACTSSSGGPAAGSASAAPQPGGTLHVVRAEAFDGWDPDKASAYASYQTLAAVLEPMVRDGADGRSLEPGISTSWDYSAPKKTWTFHLRDGVTFSDGTPLSAADVVFSTEIWKSGANFGSLYANIKSVHATDAHTVVFDLDTPDTTLPVLMSWTSSAVYPKNFQGKTKAAYYAKPVGAGAFTITSWSPGGQIVLARSTHYYQAGRPYVDQISIDVVTDANQRAVLFQSGQAAISEYVSSSEAPQYGNSLIALPVSQVEHLSLNVTRPVLADPGVRKAIADAIDVGSIVTGAYRGYGATPQGIIPPNLGNWAPPTIPGYAYSTSQAKTDLAASKHPNPGTLEVVFDSSIPTDNLVAQIVQQNLAAAGITLKLSGLETGAFLDRAYGHTADMVLWSYGAVSPDAVDPMGWVLGTSWLFTGAPTDQLSKAYAAYTAAQSGRAKETIIAGVQDQALRDAQAIPLADYKVLQGVSSKVHGFASAPWGLYYWDPIWIEH
jgi:peptide/nickel transport system substrate-binding protein